MQFAFDVVLMNFRMKSISDAARCSRELDVLFAFRSPGYSKSLCAEPALGSLHIGIRRTELLPYLPRREPMMEDRGVAGVDVLQELLQRLFPFRGAVQQQENAVQGQRVRHASQIVSGLRQRMHVAGKREPFRFVNRFGNQPRWCLSISANGKHKQ